MKHLAFSAVLTCVLICSLIMFVSSCENGDSYYILFDIGGERFEFLRGLTEVEEHAWVSEINEFSNVDLYFFATPNVETGLTKPDDHIWFIVKNVEVDATGSYTTVEVYYRQDGISYRETAALVEITAYGVIGEVLEGSFSATVDDGGPSIEITNGAFRTIRTADNSYAPFD